MLYLIFCADLCLCPFFFCCCAEGCPGLCNGNGRCTLGNNGWYCVCQLGWRGTGCDTSMETACSDVKDNDGGKITNNTKHQQGLLTRHNLTIESTRLFFFRIYRTWLMLSRLSGTLITGENEQWFSVSHLDNRFFIKEQSSWPEAPSMRWPQEEVPALPSN